MLIHRPLPELIIILRYISIVDLGVHVRCPSLELESHDCIHELVEGISQGPPTRTLLRLQSLGTDYGSDEFGTCTSSEDNAQAREDEIPIPTVELSVKFGVVILIRYFKSLFLCSNLLLLSF